MTLELLYRQPAWIREILPDWNQQRSGEEIMQRLHRVARRNISQGGGPFAAAVAYPDGRLVEVNVNQVVPANDCGAHAEGVAMPNAQRILCGSGKKVKDLHGFYLYTTGMPCTACAGRIWLFRPSKVFASVSKQLIEQNSPFTEGPVGSDFWSRAKAERGIELIESFGFGDGEEALAPFKEFMQALKSGKTESYLERN